MGAGTDVFFERVLLPHRSLPPRGFNILMLLSALSVWVWGSALCRSAHGRSAVFSASMSVCLSGVPAQLSQRAAARNPRLAGEDFTVERIDVYGERRSWIFSRSGCG